MRTDGVAFEDTYARIFRDLKAIRQQFVEFWELLSRQRVIDGNLESELLGTKHDDHASRRLRLLLREPGFRLGRNALYDHIEPAVSFALTDEALLKAPQALEECYVKTSERIKYDSRLQMYLQDIKPPLQHATQRVRGRKNVEVLDERIRDSHKVLTPRFVVVLGLVGAGKTTFLHYIRMISAQKLINGKILWLYLDFKKTTASQEARSFIYAELLRLIEEDREFDLGDWDTTIQAAYNDDIETLSRGPLRPLYKADSKAFLIEVSKQIFAERNQVEPYVEKILKYISKKVPGYLIIDNVDQIDDSRVQQTIFVEAQAVARRIGFNVVMSLRDATYLRHRNSPAFDAFQFDSLYVDPPPVSAVLSRRLSYAKRVLQGRSAEVTTEGGIKLRVKDLSAIFDIVSSSLLAEKAGYMLEVMSGNDVRRGLHLVREFLASGHTTSDRAIQSYLADGKYQFPPHEVFRGAVLEQRKYYAEEESLLPNVYDSHLGTHNFQLLRLHLLSGLVDMAATDVFEGHPVEDLISDFHRIGISDTDLMQVLATLVDFKVINTTDGLALSSTSKVYPTRFAGYILRELCKQFAYNDFCVIDTPIYDEEIWNRLAQLTDEIEFSRDTYSRVQSRMERIKVFFEYIDRIEELWVVECKRRTVSSCWCKEVVKNIVHQLQGEFDRVLTSAAKNARRVGSASSNTPSSSRPPSGRRH